MEQSLGAGPRQGIFHFAERLPVSLSRSCHAPSCDMFAVGSSALKIVGCVCARCRGANWACSSPRREARRCWFSLHAHLWGTPCSPISPRSCQVHTSACSWAGWPWRRVFAHGGGPGLLPQCTQVLVLWAPPLRHTLIFDVIPRSCRVIAGMEGQCPRVGVA